MYSSVTISEIRRRISALKRRLALPYAIVRITPLADDFANRCGIASVNRDKPWPDFRDFGKALGKLGYPSGAFNLLNRYLRGCQQRGEIPRPPIIVATFLSPDSPFSVGPAYEKHYEMVWNAASSVTAY